MKKLVAIWAGPIMIALALVIWAPAAKAEQPCVVPWELGEWVNISSDPIDIVRLKITEPYFCWRYPRDANGDPVSYYGPRWYVEVTGTCNYAECAWGRAAATMLDSRRYGEIETYMGTATLTPWFASFDRKESRKYLYINLSPEEEGILNVRVYTDYPDGSRRGSEEHLRFRKVIGGPLGPSRRGVTLTIKHVADCPFN